MTDPTAPKDPDQQATPPEFLDLRRARQATEEKIDEDLRARREAFYASVARRQSSKEMFAGSSAGESLSILAEGDSWFHFPCRKHVIRHLGSKLHDRGFEADVLNLAHWGHESVQMLSLHDRKALAAELVAHPFQILLFSGGGNDLVGDPLVLWVRDASECESAKEALHLPRVDARLETVRAAYEELIELRNRYRKTAIIVAHTYDFGPPNGDGVYHIGPWLKPSLVERGWHHHKDRVTIVQGLLSRFKDLLRDLEQKHEGFVVVDTQGTLAKNEWGDELHPTSAGFGKIADKIAKRIADEVQKKSS